MTFDYYFKDTLNDFLLGFKVLAEFPLGKLPLKIDVAVIGSPKIHRGDKPSPIPVLTSAFAKHNLIEFKSYRDRPLVEE